MKKILLITASLLTWISVGFLMADVANASQSKDLTIAKERVPRGSEKWNEDLVRRRESYRASQRQWRDGLRDYIWQLEQENGRMLTPSEIESAKADFIWTHFEDYVALKESEEYYREEIVRWTRTTESYLPGEDSVVSEEEANDAKLSEDDRTHKKALRKASLEFLTLESRLEVKKRIEGNQKAKPIE